MEAIIEEKLHRRKSGITAKAGGASGQKRKAEMDKNSGGQSAKFSKSDSESISSLINSVKSKTQTFHSTKKKKWYSFFTLDTGCFICVLKHGSFDIKMIIISVYLITLFVREEISEFFCICSLTDFNSYHLSSSKTNPVFILFMTQQSAGSFNRKTPVNQSQMFIFINLHLHD